MLRVYQGDLWKDPSMPSFPRQVHDIYMRSLSLGT